MDAIIVGGVCGIAIAGILLTMRSKEMFIDPNPQGRYVMSSIMQKLEMLFCGSQYFKPPLDKLNTINIMDRISIRQGHKSFAINKQHISLCIKNSANGTYYTDNDLMFVVLHEIAHVLCDEVGHTKHFEKIFKALLQYAQRMGVYNPKIPFVDNYCP